MVDKIIELLKWLFPEYQIFAGVDEGRVLSSAQSRSKVLVQGGAQQMSAYTQVCAVPRRNAASAVSSQVSGKTYRPAREDESDLDRANKIFEELPAELKKYWVGSAEDRTAVCKAFQRPYVRGFDNIRPRNAILLTGTESRGRVYAVRCISELLKKEKVFRYAELSCLDMEEYAADSENTLFLSDLYQALHSYTECVVFENIEKAALPQLDILYQLIAEGTYKLTRRYMFNKGSMVEAAGVLNTELVSEISANGKYFVLTTTQEQAKAISSLGNKFVKELGDMITLAPIDDRQKRDLAYTLCTKLVTKCRDNLHVKAVLNSTLIEKLGAEYSEAVGVKGLQKHIDENLYGPLTEMRLRNVLWENERVRLLYEGGYCVILEGGERVLLSGYLKDMRVMELEDVHRELDQVIGLDEVKAYVRNLETNYKVQKMRAEKGFRKSDISMHMIFMGNPGTGKTTIARIVAKYLKAVGMLSSGHLSEVTRADLVGQYAGHTAMKVTDVIRRATGGILFIDEAYSLCRDRGDSFGLEAIDALVKGMEDNRDDLVVILAGYEAEMDAFLALNSGLRSRFPNIVHFSDYSVSEMYAIAKVIAAAKGYHIADDCEYGLLHAFEQHQKKGKNESGNGRLVRNLIEAAILNQSQRIAQNPGEDMELLTAADFGFDQIAAFDLEKELSKVIGLETVKKYVRSLNARLRLRSERKKNGLKTDTTQTMHMIFTGNPGTGKTMMARTVARLLYSMGVIPSDKLVETDRSGLVAGYVGQTAIKTRQVIESALGGVLFIDEAYALAQGGERDYGQEAIDTLVKMMDDNRDNLVVILAGYCDDMKHFLEKNAGLQSRFAHIIEFPDYTTDELMQIAEGFYTDQGYVLSGGAREALRAKLTAAQRSRQFGNGRYVRNVFEKSLDNQALRLSSETEYTREALTVISESDVREA